MPTVRAVCLLCDDTVELPAAEITLHLGEPSSTPVDRYGFTCPRCETFVVRRAIPRVVEALVGTYEVVITSGPLAPWESTARPDVLLSDASAPRDQADLPPLPHAPAIDEADVLLFRKALDDDAILAAWVAAG